MASQINYSNLRPLPTDYILQDADLIAIQTYGSQEPQVINWGRFKLIAGSGGTGGTNIKFPALPATSGTIPITFESNKIYTRNTQTGTINFTIDMAGAINGSEVIVDIIGNSTNPINLPINATSFNGNAIDNTAENTIIFKNINGLIRYTINTSDPSLGPDVTIPIYNLQTISNITGFSANFNVQINEAGSIHHLVTTNSVTVTPSYTDVDNGVDSVNSNYATTPVSANSTQVITINSLTPISAYKVWSYAVDLSGNKTPVQSGILFTTLSADITAPTLVTSSFTNAGGKIALVYSETLANVTPSVGDFSLNLGKTVTNVLVTGSSVILTVNSPYAETDAGTISYTPGTNKIQDVVGNLATSFTNQIIVNTVIHKSTFTAADNTLLSAYTPEVGNVFLDQDSSSIKISGNRAVANIIGPNSIAIDATDIGVTNFTASILMNIANATLGQLRIRYTNFSNHVAVNIATSGGGTTAFYDQVGGVFTQFGSSAGSVVTAGVDFVATISLYNQILELRINGSLVITGTIPTTQAGTKFAPALINGNNFDNLLIRP